MKNTITVFLSREAQIKAGIVPVQKVEIALSDLLPLLDEAGRAELALCPEDLDGHVSDFQPREAACTPARCAELIVERAAKRAAERARESEARAYNEAQAAERAAVTEAKIVARAAEIIAAGDVEAHYYLDDGVVRWVGYGYTYSDDMRAARCRALDDPEWAAHVETTLRQSAAEQTRREVDWAQRCRTYVVDHVPEYARAVREGCDVSRHARTHAREEIADALGADVDVYDTQGAPSCPRASAYAELDRVRADAAEVCNPLVQSIECELVRADTCEVRGCQALRTVVEVTITWLDRDVSTLYAYADDADEHVHRDDDCGDDE